MRLRTRRRCASSVRSARCATSAGTTPRVLVRTEVWFDAGKKLRHTVTTKDGRVVEDVLETPEEVLSGEGPVWTCARIARHPVEATRDRVSCNFNGDNGTTPR